MTLEELQAKYEALEAENKELRTMNTALANVQPPKQESATTPWDDGLDSTVDETTLDVAKRLERAIRAEYDGHISALRAEVEALQGRTQGVEKTAEAARVETLEQVHARAVRELYDAIPDFGEIKKDKGFHDWSRTADMTSRESYVKLVSDALHQGDSKRAISLVRLWPGMAGWEAAKNPKPKAAAGPTDDDKLFAEYQKMLGVEQEEAPPAAPRAPDLKVVETPPKEPEGPKDTREESVDMDVKQLPERGASEAAERPPEPAGPGGGRWTHEAILDFNTKVQNRWFEKTPERREMGKRLMASLIEHNRMAAARSA